MFNNNLFAEKTRLLTPYEPNTASCVVRLDANESFYNLPETVVSELKVSLDTLDFNRYPDPNATALCTAFADIYDLDAHNVVAANGSDELLSIIANSLMSTGDVVITTAPDFSMYAFYGSLAELVPVSVAKRADFTIDFSLLDSKIKENHAKLVIFSNPCNPTGILEKKSDIEKLILENPDTIFVMDEAYLDFACMRDFGVLCDDRYSFLHDIHKYPNMFVIKTMSKAFGAASLRVGFAVGDKVVSDAFRKVKSPYNVNAVSQTFGQIILSHKDELFSRTKSIVENTDKLFRLLSKSGFADGEINCNTNFAFIKCENAKEIYGYLCEKGVFVRFFNIGGEGYLRITAGSDRENAILIDLMKKFTEEKA